MEIILITLLALNIWALLFCAEKISKAILISRDKPIPKPKPLFKPKETPETEEEKKLRILNENIENYDGTGRGQVKI